MKLKLTAEEFLSVLYDEAEGWEYVEDELVEQNRWSNTVCAIYKKDNQYFEFCYERPTTEMGCLSDHVYGDQIIREVEKVEVKTTVWKEVK